MTQTCLLLNLILRRKYISAKMSIKWWKHNLCKILLKCWKFWVQVRSRTTDLAKYKIFLWGREKSFSKGRINWNLLPIRQWDYHTFPPIRKGYDLFLANQTQTEIDCWASNQRQYVFHKQLITWDRIFFMFTEDTGIFRRYSITWTNTEFKNLIMCKIQKHVCLQPLEYMNSEVYFNLLCFARHVPLTLRVKN